VERSVGGEKDEAGKKGGVIARDVRFDQEFLTIPLLVVQGAADPVVSPEAGRTAHRLAGSSDKTIHLYDGLFHDVFHEPEHPTVLADVLNWMSARR
jgi:alpha-beta hydrolase superfamily lysophospholipase